MHQQRELTDSFIGFGPLQDSLHFKSGLVAERVVGTLSMTAYASDGSQLRGKGQTGFAVCSPPSLDLHFGDTGSVEAFAVR